MQSETPADHCIQLEITIKNAEDVKAILDKINSRRNKVAAGEIRSLPPASNMLKLVTRFGINVAECVVAQYFFFQWENVINLLWTEVEILMYLPTFNNYD